MTAGKEGEGRRAAGRHGGTSRREGRAMEADTGSDLVLESDAQLLSSYPLAPGGGTLAPSLCRGLRGTWHKDAFGISRNCTQGPFVWGLKLSVKGSGE